LLAREPASPDVALKSDMLPHNKRPAHSLFSSLLSSPLLSSPLHFTPSLAWAALPPL